MQPTVKFCPHCGHNYIGTICPFIHTQASASGIVVTVKQDTVRINATGENVMSGEGQMVQTRLREGAVTAGVAGTGVVVETGAGAGVQGGIARVGAGASLAAGAASTGVLGETGARVEVQGGIAGGGAGVVVANGGGGRVGIGGVNGGEVGRVLDGGGGPIGDGRGGGIGNGGGGGGARAGAGVNASSCGYG